MKVRTWIQQEILYNLTIYTNTQVCKTNNKTLLQYISTTTSQENETAGPAKTLVI
jgi:hypothetical protein